MKLSLLKNNPQLIRHLYFIVDKFDIIAGSMKDEVIYSSLPSCA